MYEKIKFYYCAICGVGKQAPRRPISKEYYLPSGWSGSKRRKGDCVCGDCYHAMREIARNKKKGES